MVHIENPDPRPGGGCAGFHRDLPTGPQAAGPGDASIYLLTDLYLLCRWTKFMFGGGTFQFARADPLPALVFPVATEDLPYGVELWGPGGSLVFGLDQKQDQELWMEKIREAAHGRLKALRDGAPRRS
eukprot:GAFH01000609.1.p2 GENE.GAFH01000609.1~~GAFH01000609.1.p2  ORF type:complete len:128 (-),score=31.28 GAFH01000609.1:200-583(-)